MNRRTSRAGRRVAVAGGLPRLRLEPLEAREVPALIGGLDPSFDTDGKVLIPGVPLAAVDVQADGKVVVAGTSAGDFFVARYNPDGSLDTTFDADGIATIDFGGVDAAADLVIQPDGKVVVAGTSGTDFAVARLNPNGSLDTSFDVDGKQVIDVGVATIDTGTSVALQADGKILVAGTNGVDFAVVRFNPTDGSLDGTFGTGGKATFDVTGGVDIANDVAVQGDGLILLAGTGSGNFAVARVKTDGSALDPTFDTDGKQTVDFGGNDIANTIALQADGKVLVAGTNGVDFAVVRLTTVGVPDSSFDTDGKQTVDLNGTDTVNRILLQADSKILLVGDTAADLGIARLNANGVLDGSFATGGKAVVDVAGAGDRGNDAVFTSVGRVVVAGQTATGGALARVVTELDEARAVAVGGSLNGEAKVFVPDPATVQLSPTPLTVAGVFGDVTVNVRTAVGDVNGDGIEDVVLVTGPGTAIRLAVVSGADLKTQLVTPFDPFGGNFTGGGFVSTGDFNNDGRAEVVVTPDLGGGPRVVVYTFGTDGSFTASASFFGIDDPNFRGGARSGVGDVDGDGFVDLAVAAGFQGGPRIALFDGATVLTTRAKLVGDFFAFEDTLRNGAFVTIGDINGDGFGDLIFGAGPGGAPRLLAINGQALLTNGAVTALAAPLVNFFVAGNSTDRGGVRVSTADVDGDKRAEVVVGSGELQTARARVYYGKTFTGTGEPAGFQDLDPFGGTAFGNGIFVG